MCIEVPENKGFTGKLIRRMCDDKEITVAELERSLGLANATIARWEKGAAPNSAALGKVADYFHVSVDYLLGRTKERTLFEEWNKKYNVTQIAKDAKEIETIAAHLEDKNMTDKKLKLLTQYIDALFDEE